MGYQPKKLIKDVVDPAEVQKFKKSFDTTVTKVLTEGDEGYEKSLSRWADNAVKKAGIVVQATCLDDIVKTVKFASKYNLDFAVCCGGHSTSGSSSSEGGVVLDLRKLNKVRVDPEKKLIYAQGGALFGEVESEAWKYGLATVGGLIDHTGIGGLTLGGGFGHLTGRHGLTIDNLVGVTIVTADGEARELSESKNEDLFWAVRGCGANFGVAYEFIYKAHEQKEAVTGCLAFPRESLDSLVEAVNVWLKKRGPDEDVALIISRYHPEHKPVIYVVLFSNDPSEKVFQERFSTIYKCGEHTVMEQIKRVPYPKVNSSPYADHGDRKALLNAPITHLNVTSVREAFDSFVKLTTEHPTTSGSDIEIDLFDPKKFSSVPSDSTAFYSRKPIFNITILQRWKNKEDDKIIYEWAKGIQQIFSKDGFNNDEERPLYVNFESTMGGLGGDEHYNEEKMVRMFGKNLKKLKELKKKYDPNVLFRKGAVVWP